MEHAESKNQCQLLELSRATAYYQATPVSATELAVMRWIDELHLDDPFAGARMLRDLLRRQGHASGRKRVGPPLPEPVFSHSRSGKRFLWRRIKTPARKGGSVPP